MIYSVEVLVDRSHAADWSTWMRDVHIPEVLDTACFRWCEMVRVPEADTDARVAFRMIYRLVSKAAWETYQSNFAPALKADHSLRYEGKVSARREVLEVVASFVMPDDQ